MAESLAERFRRFAGMEAAGVSPLYEAACRAIADDDRLLALAANARPGQQAPNLFLGIIHDLLLDHPDHSLGEYYPSVGGTRAPDTELASALRSFCEQHEARILELLPVRLVQTNEPRRSAALVAGLCAIASTRPLRLIELGASAGLNLIFDRYRIHLGEHTVGPENGVAFKVDVEGPLHTVLPNQPQIADRVGVDLEPIDPRDPEQTRWLRALVWPDQPERRRLLDDALTLSSEDPPTVLRGDLITLLPELVEQTEDEHDLVIFHAATWAHLTESQRADFLATLRTIGKHRPVWWLSLESGIYPFPTTRPWRPCHLLGVSRITSDWSDRAVLALVDGHGAWMDWGLHRLTDARTPSVQ